MKSEIITPTRAFQPVSIQVTFESQAELDALGTLLNVVEVNIALQETFKLPRDPFEELRDSIESAGVDINKNHPSIRKKLFSK